MTNRLGPVEAGIEVHRLGRDGRQAFYWIFGILGAPLILLTVLAYFDKTGRGPFPRMLGVFGVFAAVTAFVVIRSRQIRLEILEDGFRYFGMFRNSRYRYDEIAGFRHAVGRGGGRSGEWLGILCDSRGRERVRISSYLERPKRLREWIGEHFADLDAADLSAERRLLGETSGETARRLSRARILTKILNVAGVTLALLLLFGGMSVGVVGPRWGLVTGLVLAAPWVALGMAAHYGPLLSLEGMPYRSRRARIEGGLIVPMLAGVLAGFAAPPVHTREAWPWAILAAGLLFLALRRWSPRLMANRFMMAFFAASSLAYGYGLVCYANAVLDRGPETFRTVEVRNRSTRRGRWTVQVSLPPERDETRSLNPPPPIAQALSPGRPAVLLIKPGALGFEWIAAIAPAP